MSSFALVSNRQPATAVPPAYWAHDVRNVLASVGIHLDALARLSGPHGARAANAGHALISKVSSDYRALQSQVRELQRLLGKKTLEAEILKEALENATGSNKQLRLPLSAPKDGSR